MTSNRLSSVLLLAAALALAACTSSSSNDQSAAPPVASRGAITAADPVQHTITVNSKTLSVPGAAVTEDGAAAGEDRLTKGTVVTVKGDFGADDRNGTATHVGIEHGLEARVDDKGTDFILVAGQAVHVDDSAEFGEDNPARLASVQVGAVVRISGVADDKGGLRASRIDNSARNGGSPADDGQVEVKGFVSSLSGGAFRLSISPGAVAYWNVDASGVMLPAGVANGSFVEVHTANPPTPGVPPVLGTLVATSVQLEDRATEGEVEVEGIVVSGGSDRFVVDGTTVTTTASTTWALGAPADLVPGVKVEAEGTISSGVLQARKVSFRPGARLTAAIEAAAQDGTSVTALGLRVQTPSFMDNDFGPLTVGARVEVRGNPSADGAGLVASRVTSPGGGNSSRVFLRAVATAKANGPMTFTVMGFTVTTAGATFRGVSGTSGVDGPVISADQFYGLVDTGHTVLKVRAPSAASVDAGAKTFAADELEIEGNDG